MIAAARGASIALGLVVAAAAAGAQLTTSVQTAVAEYQTALRVLETHAKGQRVEPAFDALLKVRDALTAAAAGGSVLEALSDADLEQLRERLPGVLINRDEVVFVEPDPDFFVQLAVGHGDEVDRQFYAALKATYPETVWPIYVEQQTDYSGCTRFGTGKLVEMHRTWARFRDRNPKRYAAAARDQLVRVNREIVESTCACGDAASVTRELEGFLRSASAPTERTRVAERLAAVRSGRSDLRLHCTS